MNNFSQPHELDQSKSVFEFCPPMTEIPDEFTDGSSSLLHRSKWERAASQWFYEGIKKTAFTAKEGIDAEKAFKHLGFVLGSWNLKHEHKMAAVAYLMSLWFDDVSF